MILGYDLIVAMISYAQNFEDVILNRVFGERSTGFYIDVGAMDPLDGSVTKHFYDRGWRGINIEPDERFYRRLVEARPRDINLNVALGNAVEKKSLYVFDVQGLATFNTDFRDYFTARHFTGHETVVDVTTLATVCRQYVHEPIDFLKIDAEGWEGPILEGASWEAFRPLVIVIESTEPFSHVLISSTWEPILLNAEYKFVYFDGLNRFYIPCGRPDLEHAFQYPPNVLDDFTRWSEVDLWNIKNKLVQELDALRAERDALLANCSK